MDPWVDPVGCHDEAIVILGPGVSFKELNPGEVCIFNGENYIAMCPDGKFIIGGEVVNKDDLDRGRKVYEGFRSLVGV
jgi:hypothetical protein